MNDRTPLMTKRRKITSLLCCFLLAGIGFLVCKSPVAITAYANEGGTRARLLPMPSSAIPLVTTSSARLRVLPAHTLANSLSISVQGGMNGRDFNTFSHRTPQHSAMACASCHHRKDNSPIPAVSGHKDCTSCHLAQFVTPNVPMCAICHTNLNSANPPVKNFPRLASFNVVFDHAQHSRAPARPANDCAACHLPTQRGVAKTIPAGFTGNPGGHTQCYTCHTPGSTFNNRDMASCSTCHKQGGYRRTPTTARSFQVSFSHADHAGKQNLSCADCHTLRAGAPQSRQVSAPLPQQHFQSTRAQSCMSCHNGRRAFGDRAFGDCSRCHTGNTFRMKS